MLELCRIKLLQYHTILNPVVPNHNKDARQALSGMLEVNKIILDFKLRQELLVLQCFFFFKVFFRENFYRMLRIHQK